MFGRDEAWVDAQAAALDLEVVIATAVPDAAHLDDVQPPSLRAEPGQRLFERDDAVRDAVQLEIAARPALVVEEQHGAGARREEVLERQDLAAIADRALCEQAEFGQAVDYHALRAKLVDLGHHVTDRLAELDLARVQQRLFVILAKAVGRDHLEQRQSIQRPAVRLRDRAQLDLGLGERDIQPGLTN